MDGRKGLAGGARRRRARNDLYQLSFNTLRADLAVNTLVGSAYTTGQILLTRDGTPERPPHVGGRRGIA
jgi:hypothetical protein